MAKYQCDFVLGDLFLNVRCPNPANMAFDDGDEMHQFCHHHFPNTDWHEFSRIYSVKNDELVEIGISKQKREQFDQLIMHALGVQWEEL